MECKECHKYFNKTALRNHLDATGHWHKDGNLSKSIGVRKLDKPTERKISKVATNSNQHGSDSKNTVVWGFILYICAVLIACMSL